MCPDSANGKIRPEFKFQHFWSEALALGPASIACNCRNWLVFLEVRVFGFECGTNHDVECRRKKTSSNRRSRLAARSALEEDSFLKKPEQKSPAAPKTLFHEVRFAHNNFLNAQRFSCLQILKAYSTVGKPGDAAAGDAAESARTHTPSTVTRTLAGKKARSLRLWPAGC